MNNKLIIANRLIKIAEKLLGMNINKDDLNTLWYENENGDKHVPDMEGGPMDDIPEGYEYQMSQFPNVLRTIMLGLNEDGTSYEIGWGESTYPEDLVLAMANSGDWSLGDAILIVANSCERCMNALAEQYGLDWGYKEYSDEWQKSNTVCDFCREDEVKQAKFVDNDGRTEYFVNPTAKELGSVTSGIVRFIADNTSKQVYCWDGEARLHFEGVPFLGFPSEVVHELKREYLLGAATKRAGKYEMLDAYLIDRLMGIRGIKGRYTEIVKEVLNTDWSWVDPYINVSEYLINQRDDFYKLLESYEMINRM